MSDVRLRPVKDADLERFFVHYQDPVAAEMAAFVAMDPADRGAFDAKWEAQAVTGRVSNYQIFSKPKRPDAAVGYLGEETLTESSKFWGGGGFVRREPARNGPSRNHPWQGTVKLCDTPRRLSVKDSNRP